MANINYEEMSKMYKEASMSESKPDLTYTNLETLRNLYGDEQVEKWIADGTIKFLEVEDIGGEECLEY